MLMPGLVPGIGFSAPAMAVRRRPASLGGKALCAPGEYRSARQSGPDLLAAEMKNWEQITSIISRFLQPEEGGA